MVGSPISVRCIGCKTVLIVVLVGALKSVVWVQCPKCGRRRVLRPSYLRLPLDKSGGEC